MPKKNFKLIIQYLGTNYNGWQYQPNCPTIQEEIENAFKKILHKNKQKVNLVGSGRTDSGVHALGQVANIIINSNITENELKNAINSNLGNDIYIKDCSEVNLSFNSRFSAKKRCYIYKITKTSSPFNYNRTWFNNYNIDLSLMNKAAELVLGNHDFSLLSKTNTEIDNKNCYIYKSEWKCLGNEFIYTIEANRFLHHMVRYLVGAMVEVGKDNLSINHLMQLLNNETKNISTFKAPAQGLYLKKVYYE